MVPMAPALISTFLVRFGPWLGRYALAAPAAFKSFLEKLRKADPKAKLDGSVRGVISYVAGNPIKVILIITSLAAIGVKLADILGGDKAVELVRKKSAGDTEALTFIDNLLDRERTLASSTESFDRTIVLADQSAKLELKLADNETETEMAREILIFAVSFFGTKLAALNGHRLLQAFMEMPHRDVAAGLNTLDLSRRRTL